VEQRSIYDRFPSSSLIGSPTARARILRLRQQISHSNMPLWSKSTPKPTHTSPILANSANSSYPWPIVTLAWFLRYPNPYATHVLSTDTIHQSLNPQTQRLKVVRLHLKRGKLPVWSKRFLSHISESWIVETTEVDLLNGRMETRMRNLDHKRVLYVEERGSWSKLGENQ
jgi:hypothetical protein